MKRAAALLLAALLALAGPWALGEKSRDEIIVDIITFYGYHGEKAENRLGIRLYDLENVSPPDAEKWRRIVEAWRWLNEEMELKRGEPVFFGDEVPEGRLCVVVMGYSLTAGGSLMKEGVTRLRGALACAEMWPDALILCTGGHTASAKKDVSEAGRMKKWLVKNGVDESRILTEENSLSTAENARFSWDMIRDLPDVAGVVLVTSDYHMRRALIDFTAESILREEEGAPELPSVCGYAACKVNTKKTDRIYQAGDLLDLAGFPQIADKVYDGLFKAPKF